MHVRKAPDPVCSTVDEEIVTVLSPCRPRHDRGLQRRSLVVRRNHFDVQMTSKDTKHGILESNICFFYLHVIIPIQLETNYSLPTIRNHCYTGSRRMQGMASSFRSLVLRPPASSRTSSSPFCGEKEKNLYTNAPSEVAAISPVASPLFQKVATPPSGTISRGVDMRVEHGDGSG